MIVQCLVGLKSLWGEAVSSTDRIISKAAEDGLVSDAVPMKTIIMPGPEYVFDGDQCIDIATFWRMRRWPAQAPRTRSTAAPPFSSSCE